MPKNLFILPMQVRTYECDYAQIVNNANYLKFFEQARHEYTLRYGLDTIQLALQGVVLVVAKIDIRFIRSLQVNDRFDIHTTIKERTPMRMVFEQTIYKQEDPHQPITYALTTVACVIDGKPAPFPKNISDKLFSYEEKDS